MFADSTDIVSPNLLPAVIGALVFVVVGCCLMPLIWKLIDRMTPGNLNEEICPANPSKGPNTALAIVVGALILGFAHIIASAIH